MKKLFISFVLLLSVFVFIKLDVKQDAQKELQNNLMHVVTKDNHKVLIQKTGDTYTYIDAETLKKVNSVFIKNKEYYINNEDISEYKNRDEIVFFSDSIYGHTTKWKYYQASMHISFEKMFKESRQKVIPLNSVEVPKISLLNILEVTPLDTFDTLLIIILMILIFIRVKTALKNIIITNIYVELLEKFIKEHSMKQMMSFEKNFKLIMKKDKNLKKKMSKDINKILNLNTITLINLILIVIIGLSELDLNYLVSILLVIIIIVFFDNFLSQIYDLEYAENKDEITKEMKSELYYEILTKLKIIK